VEGEDRGAVAARGVRDPWRQSGFGKGFNWMSSVGLGGGL